MAEALRERGVQLVSLCLLVLVWEFVSLTLTSVMPSPVDVFPNAWDRVVSGDFWEPLSASLIRLSVAVLLVMLVGTAFGIGSARVGTVGTMFQPTFVVLMTTPSLLVIFTAMMVVGRENSAVILASVIIVFSFVAVPIRDALKDVDEDILNMADSFRVSSFRRILDVYIPHLIPSLLATFRMAFAFSWKIVIISEIFGLPSGLGWKLSQAYFSYRVEDLLAWLLMFIVVILVMEQLLRTLERRVVRWQ